MAPATTAFARQGLPERLTTRLTEDADYVTMARKKKLSPSGSKDQNGSYHNAHLSLHEDELSIAGLEIGDEVFVRVYDDSITVQKAD
ncbi:hypothetical protein [Halococcus sediminicola]|uniref:hypothetical protein n=1 Tax=Halococcus sediminicola TaxID=1264579 RepID=UPI0012ABD857|nr:hypothetical protein [Halococcus sediminicola]